MSRRSHNFAKHPVSSAQIRALFPAHRPATEPIEAYIASVPVIVRKRLAAKSRQLAAQLARQDADAALFMLASSSSDPVFLIGHPAYPKSSPNAYQTVNTPMAAVCILMTRGVERDAAERAVYELRRGGYKLLRNRAGEVVEIQA